MVWIAAGGVVQGNGSGSSQTVRICNSTYWSASDGPVNGPTGWPSFVLPVELVGVDAHVVDGDVQLLWSTASERDASHFTIERSDEVRSWAAIGRVEAVGSSTQLTNYQFVDHEVAPGGWYYRLVQHDVDGSYTFSDAVHAQVFASGDRTSCSPSIVTPSVSELLVLGASEEPNSLLLREASSGRSYPFRARSHEEGRKFMQLPELPDGMYIIQSQNTGAKVCRFLVLN